MAPARCHPKSHCVSQAWPAQSRRTCREELAARTPCVGDSEPLSALAKGKDRFHQPAKELELLPTGYQLWHVSEHPWGLQSMRQAARSMSTKLDTWTPCTAPFAVPGVMATASFAASSLPILSISPGELRILLHPKPGINLVRV